MLTLYTKTGCPYCIRVLKVMKGLNLKVTEKNISEQVVADELIKRGGKRQVPYLIDTEREVEMYESEDIVRYLCENYGIGPSDVPPGDNVCAIEYDEFESR